MNNLLKQIASLSLVAKSVAAIAGILLIHATFSTLERTLPRDASAEPMRVIRFYGIRRLFSGYLSDSPFSSRCPLFGDRLGHASAFLPWGSVSAGVAVALQDVVASIAGAISIGFSRLYALGDRVQIGDTRGDVIEHRAPANHLCWKQENWVSRDLYNGRIVRIPNSTVLRGSVFNYSQGFKFIWEEIKVLFTTTSDYRLAREMLLRVATEAVGGYLLEAQISWKAISDNYRSANPPLEPTVALAVNASGSLEFTVSYVVDYTKRTVMRDQLFTKIVEEVANSNGRLEWASPAVSCTRQPPTPKAIEAHRSFSTHTAAHAGSTR